jgi:hypothetical protein
MSLLIGMDEAGLGPNLGPFVVAATVWDVPGPPNDFDFWTAFDTVLTRTPTSCDPRLHIADSKQVFQPHRGIAPLERGVTSALRLCGVEASTFRELCNAVSGSVVSRCSAPLKTEKAGSRQSAVGSGGRAGTMPEGTSLSGRPPTSERSLFDEAELSAARSPTETARTRDDDEPLPWYDGDGLALPVESADTTMVEPWTRACERLGVTLVAIRADVVEPLRFNRLVRRYDNKSQATSRLAMSLLRGVWEPGEDALIVADKHGGRNRYDTLLSDTFGLPVECLTEGADRSIYRIGRGELRFQPRAEIHGPVALASMTAKYLRELAMHQFNRFWQDLISGLKPTQGYPVDAKRFRDAIADEQRRLDISNDFLWRER